MNNDKELFRQALQRQNERAAKMKMPDDMEQRVLGHLTHSPHREKESIQKLPHLRRSIGMVVAAAACILLLLMFYIGKNTTDDRHPIAQQSIEQSYPQPMPQPIVEEKKEEVVAEVRPTPQPAKKRRKAVKEQNTSAEPVLAQTEPIIPAEATSQPQVHVQPYHEAKVSSMNVGNEEVDPKMLLYTAEVELEKNTHQRQEASEKEMMKRGLELLIYFMTEKEEEAPARVVNTQKS